MTYSHTRGTLNFFQIQIKAFLEANHINPHISNMKHIQKAVYDAKCNGEDLGYYFADYPSRGMYSPELRNDVERLNGVMYWDPAD